MVQYYRDCITKLNVKDIIKYNLLKIDSCPRANPFRYLRTNNDFEKESNDLLDGYPQNHNYQLQKGKIVPGFKLFHRIQSVTPLYPENMNSFLDIASCKGYYVFDAAMRFHSKISVGIDIHEPFVSIANNVKEYINIENVFFYQATLEEIAADPEAFGGPFETVLFLGAYHYYFWGSSYNPKAFYCHHEILNLISEICTDRIIFSGRLETDRLPRYLQKKAKEHNISKTYDTKQFLKTANDYFDVKKVGYLGRDELFVLSKK